MIITKPLKKVAPSVKIKKWSQQLTKMSQKQQEEWNAFLESNKNIPSSRKYNITICEAPKFIWFRNAKVGTRSILKMFDEINLKLTAEHPNNCYYSPGYYADYFKFAFVRNPYDRLVSGWLNKVVKNNHLGVDDNTWQKLQSFENFVHYIANWDLNTCNVHFRKQSSLIDTNELDYIGRLEEFNKHLLEINTILGLPQVQVPHSNQNTKRDDYHTYYSGDLKNKVEKMYQKDIQLFGYTF